MISTTRHDFHGTIWLSFPCFNSQLTRSSFFNVIKLLLYLSLCILSYFILNGKYTHRQVNQQAGGKKKIRTELKPRKAFPMAQTSGFAVQSVQKLLLDSTNQTQTGSQGPITAPFDQFRSRPFPHSADSFPNYT